MIDTVQLRHRVYMPSTCEMQERGFLSVPNSQAGRWRWSPKTTDRTLPRLTWATSLSGDWLTAEVSVPKLLYEGNTVQINSDEIAAGLAMISDVVSEVSGVGFEASTALVGRVDYYQGFPVGAENIQLYLDAVSGASYPRLVRRIIENSAVTFATPKRTREVQLYDKHCEVLARKRGGRTVSHELAASAGILRLEVRYKSSDACKRLADKYDLHDRTARDLLTVDIACNELDEALLQLGLKTDIVSNDERIDAMRKAFGDTSQFCRLLGFTELRNHYGESFWQHGIGGYSRSKYYRDAGLIRKKGIGLTGEQSLPPLRLEWPAVKSEDAVAVTRSLQT